MYNSYLTHIADKIQNLYSNLKSMNILDLINYHFSHFSQIYCEQSKCDEMMSYNFDTYFQTKEIFMF